MELAYLGFGRRSQARHGEVGDGRDLTTELLDLLHCLQS
jgi:hypothetical protein